MHSGWGNCYCCCPNLLIVDCNIYGGLNYLNQHYNLLHVCILLTIQLTDNTDIDHVTKVKQVQRTTGILHFTRCHLASAFPGILHHSDPDSGIPTIDHIMHYPTLHGAHKQKWFIVPIQRGSKVHVIMFEEDCILQSSWFARCKLKFLLLITWQL